MTSTQNFLLGDLENHRNSQVPAGITPLNNDDARFSTNYHRLVDSEVEPVFDPVYPENQFSEARSVLHNPIIDSGIREYLGPEHIATQQSLRFATKLHCHYSFIASYRLMIQLLNIIQGVVKVFLELSNKNCDHGSHIREVQLGEVSRLKLRV